MKHIIIYNAANTNNLDEINYYVKNFKKHIQVGPYIWIVEGNVSSTNIRNYLVNEIGANESILVFGITKDWAIANSIDVSDWLED
ncbi:MULTISPECIES: hypothetical protein [Acinetobacter]|uniref:hypothetical protein n=1 Tax=Acinetobacter TaxID=469 RepID=UPI0002AE8C02|nr:MULTISPECIES: hypothetical protein [Acinetobacter]ELW77301.1 hypothetical protein ACINWC743_2810 [Acinetobacter sp. WC-743]MCU4599106.1 hypothetical protein [Acinetobacter bereziniae]